ncbi:hypothetical protein C0J52_08070 [Blattella germanica]|nr:hypothetical protein C0J52_08070 [Blattella germanica]PSN48344.1 hypothetical protein C0J52_08070 [Blattella germanica]PSN48345.1 hypothetical protein C0J52_08070 [Blattella germanica]
MQANSCKITMESKLEQRANIKFCVTIGCRNVEKTYGNEAMSRTRCFEWHSSSKNGRTSPEDDERPGRMKSATKSMIFFFFFF